MRALQFSRDTCLTNLSFIFPLDSRCSSGFRWKLSLFRICQIGVAHIIYAYSKAAASFVTHFIFFSYHSTIRLYPINYIYAAIPWMRTYRYLYVKTIEWEIIIWIFLVLIPFYCPEAYIQKLLYENYILSCEIWGFVLSGFFYEICVYLNKRRNRCIHYFSK